MIKVEQTTSRPPVQPQAPPRARYGPDRESQQAAPGSGEPIALGRLGHGLERERGAGRRPSQIIGAIFIFLMSLVVLGALALQVMKPAYAEAGVAAPVWLLAIGLGWAFAVLGSLVACCVFLILWVTEPRLS
ncbi:MAG: hypothetical protein HW416_590 [Chloroflexi bacterium]|nr:hypothetical protein [Chloroflexota bacterium]